MDLKILGAHGPYPVQGACSGYLLEDNNFSMLLDCGCGVLSKLLSTCPLPDVIFISHLHYDHTSDLLPYRYYLEGQKKQTTVLTEESETEWYKLLFSHPDFTVINIRDKQEIVWKGKTLSFFRTKHAVPNLGIKVSDKKSTFVYTGDTAYFEGLEQNFVGADCVLCDAAQPHGFVGGHISVDKIPFLMQGNPKKLLLTHISPFGLPNIQNLEPNIEFAEEGKTYHF